MMISKLFYTVAFLSVFSLPCFAAENLKPSAKNNVVSPVANRVESTRPDAVIYKIHNVEPVKSDGVVKGCDFIITLFNRTSINFRTFTINLSWVDTVDQAFQFDSYVESLLGTEAFKEQKNMLNEYEKLGPTQTAITVNAFGAGKQLSLHQHMNSEKCYLLMNVPNFSVTPCDIVRSVDAPASATDSNNCTSLFQYVSIDNPEYFGEFQQTTATEENIQKEQTQIKELSDIDVVIGKIIDNIDVSDKTLSGIQ